MEERRCIVIFEEATGRALGQIRQGDEVVKELSFYLGKLHQRQPDFVEDMLRNRYAAWAKVNGVTNIELDVKLQS